MQLTAKSIVLDYYPIKNGNNNILPDKFLRVLSFKGDTQTKRIISEEQMNEEILDRVSNYNYNVTDNHANRPQLHTNLGGVKWLQLFHQPWQIIKG